MYLMRSQERLRFSRVPCVPDLLRWMERKSLRKSKVRRKGIAADVKEQLECGKLFCGMGNSVVESLHVRVRGEASKHDIVAGTTSDPLNVSEEVDSLSYTLD